MSTKTFYQLVHTLSYGDAISTEVLTLDRSFRDHGHDSWILALNIHPIYREAAFQDRVVRLSDFVAKHGAQLKGELLLHYSLGSPLNQFYQEQSSARRTLIYHNLTPPRWFKGINPRVERDIEQGMLELPVLCGLSDLLLADSSWNQRELADLGFKAETLRLPLDPERWSMARNEEIYALVKQQPGVQLFHAGRLAPNKCIEDIIKVFYYLLHHYDDRSRLRLVGIDTDTELYSFGLKQLCNELSVAKAVEFCGHLADCDVRALYESSTAYLCMSEHEGFCLPVLEAMFFGLPVAAFSGTALTETVGAGGVLFTEKRHSEIAELLINIKEDQQLREHLIAAGKKQVAQHSLERFNSQVKKIFWE